MIDCSRGAVPLVETVQQIIRYCALMGINTLQLYTEDTYKIQDEQFFGYCRGPYTEEELSTIDNYAFMFGIEVPPSKFINIQVIPCIQTLGHLGQILQWPRFANIKEYPIRHLQ
jgi:hypothetical protein